ncbi:MAG TPA: hypothetical protein PLH94_14255 [Fimbriimonadaceae bacterium]|nr:hypothetical protein [Fimbriimonadaceae bacterium]
MIVESYEDVITLSGALRSNFWDTVHTAIALTLKRHPTGVVVDCHGITECTADGAETFRDMMDFIQDHDARIIVARVSDPLMDVLKSVPEVRSQLPIADSVEDARKSLDLLVSDEPEKKTKKKPPVAGLKAVLVCISGRASDDDVLRMIQRLDNSHELRAYLVYPLVVPRELPLKSPLPELEASAADALKRARAILEESQVHCDVSVGRGRDVASTIVEALEASKATEVIVGLGPDADSESEMKLMKLILTRVTVPLLFVRGRG